MNVMVTGSRHWTDHLYIRDVLAMLWRDNPTILHGACEGADLIAAEAAEGLGFHVDAYPPLMRLPSPQRYHVRNKAMLDRADRVLAFRLIGAENRGTDSVIGEAHKRGIDVRVFEREQAA